MRCLGRAPPASRRQRLVPRHYVRFWGSPDMADYPPRLVYDANDPFRTCNVLGNSPPPRRCVHFATIGSDSDVHRLRLYTFFILEWDLGLAYWAQRQRGARWESRMPALGAMGAASLRDHLTDVRARSRAARQSCSAGRRPLLSRLPSPPAPSASMIKSPRRQAASRTIMIAGNQFPNVGKPVDHNPLRRLVLHWLADQFAHDLDGGSLLRYQITGQPSISFSPIAGPVITVNSYSSFVRNPSEFPWKLHGGLSKRHCASFRWHADHGRNSGDADRRVLRFRSWEQCWYGRLWGGWNGDQFPNDTDNKRRNATTNLGAYQPSIQGGGPQPFMRLSFAIR